MEVASTRELEIFLKNLFVFHFWDDYYYRNILIHIEDFNK